MTVEAGVSISLRCPGHPGSGELTADGTGAGLRCPTCAAVYPVVEGIADMLPPSDPFTRAEIEQWDTQAPRYEVRRERDLVYEAGIAAVAREVRCPAGGRILEVGCGTGMNLRSYHRPEWKIAGLDLSMESLRRAARSVPAGHNIDFIRGSATGLPFASGAFDAVVCANTLQHIPTDALRRRAFSELARVVRPGGRVVVSVHAHSARRRRLGYAKEGKAGGFSGEVQFIHRFAPAELLGSMGEAFDRVRLRGACFPLPYRFKLSPASRCIEWLLNRTGALPGRADMLVAVGSGRGFDPNRPEGSTDAGI